MPLSETPCEAAKHLRIVRYMYYQK